MTALLPPAGAGAPESHHAPVLDPRSYLLASPRLRSWLRRHRATLLVLAGVLAAVGAVTGWNLQGWPGRVNDDEGTYVAEAWAVLYPHHLSHYTYWYDHPPFGWILMAAYIRATDGFARDASAVMSGREFMWLVTMTSALLIFVLCRRLGFRRSTAAVTVLLFGLSPLGVYFHRMVSLDNIGTMWLLATLVCAASRRRSVLAAFGAAVCMAGAILSKETVAVMLPTVLWVLWQHTHERTRRWNLGVLFMTLVVIVAAYPLFAVLRAELLPGKGTFPWAGRCGGSSSAGPEAARCSTRTAAPTVSPASGRASTRGCRWRARRWSRWVSLGGGCARWRSPCCCRSW